MPIRQGDRKRLNAALQTEGFAPGTGEQASLEDRKNLLCQIACFIEDHDDFRRLLWKTAPEERMNAYLALKSRLKFEAKGFEDYMTESRIWASEEYSRSQKRSPLDTVASDAIDRGATKGTLEVTCSRCTFGEYFGGNSPADAIEKARKKGWVYDREKDKEICPKCAKKLNLAVSIQ
jgi:hypothetical protein